MGLIMFAHVQASSDLSRIKSTQTNDMLKASTDIKETPTAPQNAPEEKTNEVTPEPVAEALVDPNGCEVQGMHYRADNNECIPKTITPTAVSYGSGDCAAEIAKYDWSQTVAMQVMLAESGGSPSTVNNNPATGDYSIGCFQVNIYGANARYRPSEAELKNAAINVEWAYNNYVRNGRSFIGQWGVCRSAVACY